MIEQFKSSVIGDFLLRRKTFTKSL